MPPGVRPSAVLGPIYASTLLTWMAYALVAVALPFRFEALGLSVVEYGWVVSGFALGMLLTESAWGAYAHRVARPSVVRVLGVVIALLFVALAFLDTLWAFALAYAGLGMLTIFAIPLVRGLAFSALGPGTGSAATGRYAVSSGVGLAIGAALGTWVYEGEGFLVLCAVAAVIWLVGNGALNLLPWDRIDVRSPGGSLRGQFRRVFTGEFAVVVLLVTILYACTTLTSNFLQYYSVALFGGTPTDSGLVIGAARAVSLAAGFLIGPHVDRWGARRSAPLGFLLLVLGALGTFFARSYPEMVASTLVLAAGAGWLTATLLPLALDPIRVDLRNTAIGVFGSFEDLGQIVGPFLIGGAYALFGATSSFLAVAATAGLGLVAALALGLRRGPRPEAVLPGPPDAAPGTPARGDRLA